MVLGKAIGSGIPVSAVVARQEIIEAMPIPAPGTTLRAHATAAGAGLEMLQIVREQRLPGRSPHALAACVRESRFEGLACKLDAPDLRVGDGLPLATPRA